MIVVTGGAGFIGSNLVKALNARGRDDVVVVDDLSDGAKFRNLVDCDLLDYRDKEAFWRHLEAGTAFPRPPDAILHQGACTDTRERNGRFMLQQNYHCSKALLRYAVNASVPFLYASSAAVYGKGSAFREAPECERPVNVYGYSKLLFDRHVRRLLPGVESQVVGLRYFNVYGPREQHKGAMASVAWRFKKQLEGDRKVRLFEGCDGYGDGEQRRDFVHVDDIVAVVLWFLDHPDLSGIFNAGTGHSATFNEVARAVIGWHGGGEIEYIPFPEHLRGHYQSFTAADATALRAAGFERPFTAVAEGVPAYMRALDEQARA